MSQNKQLKLTITQDGDTGWYKVEMRDHHCNYCCVYEPSVIMAMYYAEKWFAESDKREKANPFSCIFLHTRPGGMREAMKSADHRLR